MNVFILFAVLIELALWLDMRRFKRDMSLQIQ